MKTMRNVFMFKCTSIVLLCIALAGTWGCRTFVFAEAAETQPSGTYASAHIQKDGFYSICKSSVSVDESAKNAQPFRVWIAGQGAARPVVRTTLEPGESFVYDHFLGYLKAGETVFAVLGSEASLAGQVAFDVARNPVIPVFPEPVKTSGKLSGWVLEGASATDRFNELRVDADRQVVLHTRAPHSGYYALDCGMLTRLNGSGAVRVQIHADGSPDDLPLYEAVLGPGEDSMPFRQEIGYLPKGAMVRVLLSATGAASSLHVEATLVEWAPRQAPLRVVRSADGYLGVVEPDRPGIVRAIDASRWITVPAQADDSTEALRKAFAEAQALAADGDYAGVRLEAGQTYTIGTGQLGGRLFEFHDAQRIVFDGNGSVLRVNSTNIQRKIVELFRTFNCQLMAFADFSTESSMQPYSAGDILSVSPLRNGIQEVTFRVPPGQPDPIKDICPDGRANGYAYDPEHPGRLAVGTWNHYPKAPGSQPPLWATDEPDVFVHAVTRTQDSLPSQGKWIIKEKGAGVLYLVATDSVNITLSDVEARAHGGGLLRNWNSTVNLLACRMDLQGENLISASSDGIHGRGREGVWVEDTLLRGVCEDVLNTYGRSLLVLRDDDESDNVVTLRIGRRKDGGYGPGDVPEEDIIQENDSLLFFNPLTGAVIAEVMIESIAPGGRITLSQPVPGIDFWDAGDDRRSTIVYNQSSVSRVMIRDSAFLDSMRLGAFLKASRCVLFNNRFEGLASSAIFAANEPGWPEGPPPSYLWVQGCTFKENGYDYQSRNRAFLMMDPADVSIHTARLKGPNDRGSSSFIGYANSHVKIIGNTFTHWRGMAIAVRNARNVWIQNNSFASPVEDSVMRAVMAESPQFVQHGVGGYAAIYLDVVNGAVVSGNRFAGLAGPDRSIMLDQNVQDIVVEENDSMSSD